MPSAVKPKRSKLKTFMRVIATVFGGLLAVFLILVRPDPFFNPNVVPKIVTANFIDLDRVYMISKYRSGSGHDYSANGETCRSMKHYFNVSHNYNDQHMAVRSLPTATEPNINIYAPFDGIITGIGNEHTPIGKQVNLLSTANPFYSARIFHIDLLPGLRIGSGVKSGQKIATIGPKDGTDMAIEANRWGPGGYAVSYFEAMTDQAFLPYAQLGYRRDDFIITKQYRDAHPLQCSHDKSDSFVRDNNHLNDGDDIVRLRPDPFGGTQPPGAVPFNYGPPKRTP